MPETVTKYAHCLGGPLDGRRIPYAGVQAQCEERRKTSAMGVESIVTSQHVYSERELEGVKYLVHSTIIKNARETELARQRCIRPRKRPTEIRV